MLAAAAAYAGCSDAAQPAALVDASAGDGDGAESSPPSTTVDAGDVGVPEAGRDAAFDCTNNVSDSGDGLPNDLRCTGLYSDWNSKTVRADVNRPYVPGLQLWSDGASKARWLYLPAGTKIDTTNMDEWVFPVGTKAWKEFTLGGKRVETRMFWKRATDDWERTTYRWSADESRAAKTDDGEENVNGTTYEIPAKGDCDQCHQGRKDRLLGVEAIALGVAEATGVTLAKLVSEGSLTAPPATTTIVVPNDTSGKARAALGYMHMNCGTTCHNRNPDSVSNMTGYFLRLSATQLLADGGTVRAEDTDAWKTGVDVKAVSPPYPAQGLYRIHSGDLAKSLTVTLPETRVTMTPNVGQMPPIVTHKVDSLGVLLLKTWVLSLPASDAGIDGGDGGDGG